MIYDSWTDAGIDEPHGDRWVAMLCPKCSATRKHRTHKCLHANAAQGRFRCHNAGCDYAGAVKVEDWRDKAGMAKRRFNKPDADLTFPVTDQLTRFFAKRGIEMAVVERNRVYWGEYVRVDDTTGEIEKRTPAVVFPYFRDGEVVNQKYRMGGKGFAVDAGAELIPLGLDDVQGAARVYICEGECDKLVIEQVTGSIAVLSPPNGSKPDDGTMTVLVDAVADAADVVLCGDMDEPGQMFMELVAKRIGHDRCWRVRWPDGCKDANDTLLAYGADAVRECLDAARAYPVQGIISIRDLYEEIDKLYWDGMPGGESTGWQNVDRFYTVRERQLTVVTGSPGSGKSVWLNALMLNLAENGWTFCVCSPEQMPLARHAAMLIQARVDKPFGEGPTERMSYATMAEHREWVADRFWFSMPEENTIDSVLERAAVMVRRYGVRGLVIDPWNNFDHSRPGGMTETEFVHLTLTKIRAFDMNHDLHVWLVAHPTKLRRSERDGTWPVATPYDISGSAGFFNKSDNCISVFRNKDNDALPVQIHVQKVRFAEDGGLGMAELYFDKITGRYTETVRRAPTYGRARLTVVGDEFPDMQYGD
jgi:twinkle protein